MFVPNGERRLFESAAFDFGEKIGEFQVCCQGSCLGGCRNVCILPKNGIFGSALALARQGKFVLAQKKIIHRRDAETPRNQ
jgi:hypothetical protein